MTMEQVKRTRGGQIGNHNALKHGYYSRLFTEEEKEDLSCAGEVKGLDQEIALLRHVIREAASVRDEKNLTIVVRAVTALDKLMRTRHKMNPNQDKLLKSMRVIYRDIAEPLGITPEEFLHLEKEDPGENESLFEPAPRETKNEYSEAGQL